MSQNKGTEGKGKASVLPTAEQQNATRQAKKRHQRENRTPNPHTTPAPGTGSLKERDHAEWLRKQQRADKVAQFLQRHVELALAYGLVTQLTGTAKEAAEKYLEVYAGIADKDLTTPQGVKVKRGVLATEKTLAFFPEEGKHGAVKYGIGRARAAITATYAEANGGEVTPEYEGPAKTPRTQSNAPRRVTDRQKPTNPYTRVEHARLASEHELVTQLDGTARRVADELLLKFVELTNEQLPQGIKRLAHAEQLVRETYREDTLHYERRAFYNGFTAARNALTAMWSTAKGEAPSEPTPEPVKAEPKKVVGVTPAIFARPAEQIAS